MSPISTMRGTDFTFSNQQVLGYLKHTFRAFTIAITCLLNTSNLMAELPKRDGCEDALNARFLSTRLYRIIQSLSVCFLMDFNLNCKRSLFLFYPTFRPTILPALGHGLRGPEPLGVLLLPCKAPLGIGWVARQTRVSVAVSVPAKLGEIRRPEKPKGPKPIISLFVVSNMALLPIQHHFTLT